MPREEVIMNESVDDLDLSGLNDLDEDDNEFASEAFLERAISSQQQEETRHPTEDAIQKAIPKKSKPVEAPKVQKAKLETPEAPVAETEEVVTSGAEEVTQVIEEEISTTPAWAGPLANIANDQVLKLTEYGQEYLFKRVKDPSGNATNRFEVFYKEEGEDNQWQTLNGLLTDRYVVASLSEFVSHLNNEMNLTHIPYTTREPWKAVWFGKSDVAIEYFDDETSRMIFSLITGANDVTVSNLSSNISLTVSNSYDGKRSLRVDYNVNSTGAVTSSSGSQNVKLVDFFSLGKFSHRVIHNSSITQIGADISNIQEHIEDTITTLKGYTTNIDSIVESISKGFKKENKGQFLSLCENMVPEYRKLYYVLICASAVLGGNYSIGEHIAIRSLVDKLFSAIF